jgi:hypothetical protein
MADVIAKRMAGRMDDGFVVFLIGMRVNRWWKFWRWLPVMGAMGRMLRELHTHPELGFLGAESYFGRTTLMLSYWRSKEHLMSFATSKTQAHLPAWKAFNQSVGTNGDVGIWHETYVIAPGQYESVYANMPRFGLGAAGELVEANGVYSRASTRLDAHRAREPEHTASHAQP